MAYSRAGDDSPELASLKAIEYLIENGLPAGGGGGGSTLRKSSGATAIATTDGNAKDVIAADATNTFYHLRIVNEGSYSGFYSMDEATWSRLPAGTVLMNEGVKIVNKKIQIKRAGSDNMTGVYAEMW